MAEKKERGPFRRTRRYREIIASSLTEREFKVLVRRLYSMGIEGDVRAVKELLDRMLGPSISIDIVQRIHEMEQMLGIGAKENAASVEGVLPPAPALPQAEVPHDPN